MFISIFMIKTFDYFFLILKTIILHSDLKDIISHSQL